MALWGSPDLEKWKAKGRVKGLLKALQNAQDPTVRQAAAQALGRIGVLKDTKKRGRRISLKVIGKIGPWVIRSLGSVLKSGGKGVRKVARWVLRRLWPL
jgi:HEAT repeat protein